ncbi:MAG: spermidine synthase [Hyphomicrobiaceae bacterium]
MDRPARDVQGRYITDLFLNPARALRKTGYRAMSRQFEELDYTETPIGAISLRRRFEPRVGRDVFEIKLDDAFLMSSLFTTSEIALARLGLGTLEGAQLDVVVGGLGLGCTAHTVLEHKSVGSLLVVDLLPAVIAWHERGLLPLSSGLTSDPRCRLVEGDFFALSGSVDGFDRDQPGRQFHAILLDIDHTPEALLDARSQAFYQAAGFTQLARHLLPGGIFGLWSNDKPDPEFTDRLAGAFAEAWAEPIVFDNPLQSQPATQTVYLARKAS